MHVRGMHGSEPFFERKNETVEAKASAPLTSAINAVAELVTVDNGEFEVVHNTEKLVLQRLRLSGKLEAQAAMQAFVK